MKDVALLIIYLKVAHHHVQLDSKIDPIIGVGSFPGPR
jgi:hypothetical protein